jgi:hypothetical protein
MALHFDPRESEPLAGAPAPGSVDRSGTQHRLIREGREALAHGAMVCPGCAMPVSLAEPIGVATELRCGYCETAAPARRYLVRDVYDTAANEVYLVARIG